jgi:hypothetical protein
MLKPMQLPVPLAALQTGAIGRLKIAKNFSGLFMPLCYIPAPLNEASIGRVW